MSRKSRTASSAPNKRRPVYVDCNATTPLDPLVHAVVSHFLLEEFGNDGSRTHEYGANAKKAVLESRERIAQLTNSRREDVVFTSGATEANNLAILGLANFGLREGRKHIISTQIEHKAVLEPLDEMRRRGFEVTLLAPNREGWVDSKEVLANVRRDTLLISVMHANNETGILQPISELADGLKDDRIILHTDAAQTFGKVFDTLNHPRIDLVSASAHKIFGPKGIGALIVKPRGYSKAPLSPLMFGGGQERGLRPGTVPVHLAVGFGLAAELSMRDRVARNSSCLNFRRELLAAVSGLNPVINGDEKRTLAHVINLGFPGINSEAAMLALKPWIAISNGSACTSASYEPSHVLKAMKLDEARISQALRFSWSHLTPKPAWAEIVLALRGLQ